MNESIPQKNEGFFLLAIFVLIGFCAVLLVLLFFQPKPVSFSETCAKWFDARQTEISNDENVSISQIKGITARIDYTNQECCFHVILDKNASKYMVNKFGFERCAT